MSGIVEIEHTQIAKFMGPTWGHSGAHLGPAGPRWAPCWPHEPCYQGSWPLIHSHVCALSKGRYNWIVYGRMKCAPLMGFASKKLYDLSYRAGVSVRWQNGIVLSSCIVSFDRLLKPSQCKDVLPVQDSRHKEKKVSHDRYSRNPL